MRQRLNPWSSFRRHVGTDDTLDWLDIDPCYEASGSTAHERATRYREFVRGAIPQGEWTLIREALQRGQLTGGQQFADRVEAILSRRIENRRRRRPRKLVGADDVAEK